DAVRSSELSDPDGEPLNPTASIGVVVVEADTPLDEAVLRARRRLFRAREAGRNQVVDSDTPDPDTTAKILVAEDDEISATILLHRLEKEGLDIVRYDNGREAYEAALEEVPDLVILDIKMPGMDGFEVLERLRRTPAYAPVPIILLTSMGSEADVVRGFNLGADDYVLKPFSPVELSARVWRLLRRGRSKSAL
ncbi:MAG: response regulator, partial [Longimicrobiales bacterium]|nr:response regulator [Longimicrobiales bacterium]